MTDEAIVIAVIAAAIELLFVLFAIFCVGFFIGFKREDYKLIRKNQNRPNVVLQNEKEKKNSKKEWERFLSYDGSSDSENNF